MKASLSKTHQPLKPRVRIEFPYISDPVQLSYNLPKNTTYRLRYGHCRHWQHPKFTVIEQYCQTKDTYIYLSEIVPSMELTVNFIYTHDDLYFFYQLKGNTRLWIDQKKATILRMKEQNYQISHLPAGHHQAYYKKEKRYLTFYFIIDRSLLLHFQDNSLSFLKDLLFKLTYKPEKFGSTISIPLSAKAKLYLYRLFHLPRQNELSLERYIPPILLQLITLARQEYSEEYQSQNKLILKLQQIRQQVQENIKESVAFTVEELAHNHQLTTNYLNQVHRRHYHESLQRYITRTKLAEGYRQIVEEGITPTAVALDLLFYDGAAFTRAFKKEFGILPSILYLRYHKK
ncbi:helix-turn-helix domain-containing protein [Olivibacter jilunii]|uniref:helix-turn-helix domain-containing protein n=1 Tax=Olivibacter jilunii TaxID=985016 RepID=UPI00102F7E91|nr:AraC family transcriptional regulator [Olivibacter jilunii]